MTHLIWRCRNCDVGNVATQVLAIRVPVSHKTPLTGIAANILTNFTVVYVIMLWCSISMAHGQCVSVEYCNLHESTLFFDDQHYSCLRCIIFISEIKIKRCLLKNHARSWLAWVASLKCSVLEVDECEAHLCLGTQLDVPRGSPVDIQIVVSVSHKVIIPS